MIGIIKMMMEVREMMHKNITEKEFREYCKDCHTPIEFNIVLGEVANTGEYLRRYFELNKIKEIIERINLFVNEDTKWDEPTKKWFKSVLKKVVENKPEEIKK